VAFDPEAFVAACQAAASEDDPVGAVVALVERTVADAASVEAAFSDRAFRTTLFASDALTVQRIVWPPGLVGSAHEHRMWAVVGVYAGTERNAFYRRDTGRLAPDGGRDVEPGDVVTMDRDGIHAVTNPRRGWTAGLHVYGGDIGGAVRSGWDPRLADERPVDEVMAARMPMFDAVRTLSTKLGRLSDDDRFAAYTAVAAEIDRLGRWLTKAEAEEVVRAAWS
jgi:predicted metal-dependent enzyme (double-stranded beta helix superfamily)